MIKVVFLGTPQIAVNSIMKLLNFADIHIVAVVTPTDKPANRGNKLTSPPVKICAETNGIQVFQTDSISKDKNLIKKLIDLEPDFFITFAFGQILSQEVIDIPKISTINLHASLLPEYRGANPIQRCIFDGKDETGITTMITALKLDAGDICLTEKIKITENMTTVELENEISDKSPFLLYRTLKGLLAGAIKPVKQNDDKATFAYKFTKNDCKINWNNTAQTIHNQVRALYDYPCAVTKFGEKLIKIVQTRLTDVSDSVGISGSVTKISKDGICVQTGKGEILVTKVKPESKGVINAYDWANGVKLNLYDKFINIEGV